MEALEEKLGYRFTNRAFLENALTHSSYANENKAKGIGDVVHHGRFDGFDHQACGFLSEQADDAKYQIIFTRKMFGDIMPVFVVILT